MAHRVVWSQRAAEDLEAIAEYIAEDSPAYASAVVKQILTTTRNLSQFPNSGRTVPEIGDEGVREWFAYSYRVIYQVVQALHLFHHRVARRHISFAEVISVIVLCVPPFLVSLPAWLFISVHLSLIAIQIIGSIWIKRLSPDWSNAE